MTDTLDQLAAYARIHETVRKRALQAGALRRGIVIGKAPTPGAYYVAETGENAQGSTGGGAEYFVTRRGSNATVPGVPTVQPVGIANAAFLMGGDDQHGRIQITLPNATTTGGDVALITFSAAYPAPPNVFVDVVPGYNGTANELGMIGFVSQYPFAGPQNTQAIKIGFQMLKAAGGGNLNAPAGFYAIMYRIVAPELGLANADVLIGDHDGAPYIHGALH